MPGELLSVPACHASTVSSMGIARKPCEGDNAQQRCMRRLNRYMGNPGDSQGDLLAMGFCLRHLPSLQCQRCMSKLAGGHTAQPLASPCLAHPPHTQQQFMMVKTLHGRLR